MFNLLPTKEKAEIYSQYKKRRAIISLFFTMFLFISTAIFLMPSYILTVYKEKEIQNQVERLGIVNKDKNRAELVTKIRLVNEKIRSVDIDDNQKSYYDIVEKIIAKKGSDIKIESFVVRDIVTDKKNAYQIQITGISKTRDSLFAFSDALGEIPGVERPNLPVSSLASEVDTEFVINISMSI